MGAVAKAVVPASFNACAKSVHEPYLQALTLIERVHRRLIDVIKDEFDRRGRTDINATQALLAYNLGGQELGVDELLTRGYYLGTNVTYNLKKLVQIGLVEHQRSNHDRRSVRIKLTEKGQELFQVVDALFRKHASTVEQVGDMQANDMLTLNKLLHRLERFWTDQIMYRL